MVQSRTIRSKNGDSYRVYKFTTEDEYNAQLLDFSTFFRESIRILDQGRASADNITLIHNYADDYAYKELKLGSGDLFIFTKENLSVKTIDLGKKEKEKSFQKNIPRNFNGKQLIRSPKGHGWTAEQEGHLWAGNVEEVAKIARKTISAVYSMRAKYMKEHPNFMIPDKCKLRKEKIDFGPAINGDKEWDFHDVLNTLWSDSANNLIPKLGRTRGAIYAKRVEFCRLNPSFIIPLTAQFKTPSSLRNKQQTSTMELVPAIMMERSVAQPIVKTPVPTTFKTEQIMKTVTQPIINGTKHKGGNHTSENSWTNEDLSKLWLGTASEVFDLLGGKKSMNAICCKRDRYKLANPNFVVPDNCKFKVKTTAILALKKVVDQPKVEKQIEVVPQATTPHENKATPPTSTTMNTTDMFSMLMAKAKKAIVGADGNIVFEL